jgi:hypothetical protein
MPIKQTWTADTKQAQAEIDKLQKANTRLEAKLRGVAQEGKKGASAHEQLMRAAKRAYEETQAPQRRYIDQLRKLDAQVKRGTVSQQEYRRQASRVYAQMTGQASSVTRAVRSWAGSLAGVAAGYLSIQTAIRGVVAALRDQEELRKRSRERTESISEAQAAALRNLGAVPEAQRAEFISRMEQLAQQTRVTGGVKTIYQAASMGLSASGGDVEATTRAIRTAAQIAPESAEELQAIAEALLHLGKATGTSNARENLGFLLGLGQQAAVTSMEKISRNLTPGVIGVRGYGGTAQEAGAILAALTQSMADPEGRKAATAAVNLAKQLDEYFRQHEMVTQATDSTIEQIRFLQQHEAARLAFLEKATFETKAQVPVEQMLGVAERGEEARRRLEQALPKMVSGTAAERITDQMIKGLRQPLAQKVAETTRRREVAREALETGTTAGRMRAVTGAFNWEQLSEDLKAAGVDLPRRVQAALQYWGSRVLQQGPEQAYTRAARDILTEMETGRREEISAQSLAQAMAGIFAPGRPGGLIGRPAMGAIEYGLSRARQIQPEDVIRAPIDPERAAKLREIIDGLVQQTQEQRAQIRRDLSRREPGLQFPPKAEQQAPEPPPPAGTRVAPPEDPMVRLAFEQVAARAAEGTRYTHLPSYRPGMEDEPWVRQRIEQIRRARPAAPQPGEAQAPRPAPMAPATPPSEPQAREPGPAPPAPAPQRTEQPTRTVSGGMMTPEQMRDEMRRAQPAQRPPTPAPEPAQTPTRTTAVGMMTPEQMQDEMRRAQPARGPAAPTAPAVEGPTRTTTAGMMTPEQMRAEMDRARPEPMPARVTLPDFEPVKVPWQPAPADFIGDMERRTQRVPSPGHIEPMGEAVTPAADVPRGYMEPTELTPPRSAEMDGLRRDVRELGGKMDRVAEVVEKAVDRSAEQATQASRELGDRLESRLEQHGESAATKVQVVDVTLEPALSY